MFRLAKRKSPAANLSDTSLPKLQAFKSTDQATPEQSFVSSRSKAKRKNYAKSKLQSQIVHNNKNSSRLLLPPKSPNKFAATTMPSSPIP